MKKTKKIAMCIELAASATPPEIVELIPPGQIVTGRDGRTWINDNPQAIIDNFDANLAELPIDFEHATELKAPEGDEAPAAGWISGMEARDGGAIFAQVSWTPRGIEAVSNREYRYISPVLIYETGSRRIVGIASVGLTNKPNLFLTALNRADQNNKEENIMKELLKALGLAETATEADALNAIATLKSNLATALNRAETPSLEKFVPRADYDAMTQRATNAEKTLADHKQVEMDKAINAEVDAALKAGKITPATKDYYTAMCKQDGGLELFKKFVAAAPVVADKTDLDGKKPGTDTAMNAEEQKVADMFGNSAEDIKKYGK